MYVVLSYDIGGRRVRKALAVCRKYLRHVHRSVFEGSLTDNELTKLKRELGAVLDTRKDSVLIFEVSSHRLLRKEAIGLVDESGEIV